MRMLSSKLQPGYLTNLDYFRARIPKDVGFEPFGELTHCYKVKKGIVSSATNASLGLYVLSFRCHTIIEIPKYAPKFFGTSWL